MNATCKLSQTPDELTIRDAPLNTYLKTLFGNTYLPPGVVVFKGTTQSLVVLSWESDAPLVLLNPCSAILSLPCRTLRPGESFTITVETN